MPGSSRLTARPGRSGPRISLSVGLANRAQCLYISEGFSTVEKGKDSDTIVRILR
jgi:hypothetical protein